MLEMLLRIGEHTTPVLNIQSGVARMWPLLRYLHVISDSPQLKFRSAWKEVDAHQKAIASDDFGVGLGMSVLYSAFDYAACVDGRAFLHRMNSLGLLASSGGLPPKVGSMKMADFAAIDQRGKTHIIEIKGTQSSDYALAKAMASGQDQKCSLVFGTPATERRVVGQRLVVGSLLTLETSSRGAQTTVMDPAPEQEETVEIASTVKLHELREPIIRMQVGRLLGAAGAFRTSVAITEIDRPASLPALEGPGQRDRVQGAIREDTARLQSFVSHGETWRGEEAVVPLLAPLEAGNHIYRRARLRQGVSIGLLSELQEGGGRTAFFQDAYPAVDGRMKSPKPESGEAEAALVRPGISISSIELLMR
ncbi:hypothetical protein ASC70_14210 [Caulobacter sp. Root343]|nr:hypothetical protein ASC62_14110 [Caulobacter sp. Root342]KQV66957.1 hypothetical protein ASC70_14210 [Caulobacter sp. Root343]